MGRRVDDDDLGTELSCPLFPVSGQGGQRHSGDSSVHHLHTGMAALGKRYAAGQTLPENKINALMWLTLATDFCNADVLRRVFVWQRDELAGDMSAADQETAARRAQEWREAFLSQRQMRPLR